MAHCSQSSIFPKIVEIERLPLRAAVVLVSNLPRGAGDWVYSSGEGRQKHFLAGARVSRDSGSGGGSGSGSGGGSRLILKQNGNVS